MGAKTAKLKSLIKDGIGFLKEHWNKPLEGESLSIKEFASYCFGTMGICGFTFICGETIVFAQGYFAGSIMGISLMDFSIISIIALVVRYLTLYMEPLAMTVFENLGHINKNTARKCIIAYSSTIAIGIALYFVPSAPFEKVIKGLPQIVANILVISGASNLVNWFLRKKLCRKFGRYKPFMMLYGIPIAVISSVIPFIPASMEYTSKLVLLHALFTLRGRFTALYSDNPQAIVAVITPNTVERQKIYSIGGIFLGFLRSIFRILFPVMIIVTGGYLDVRSYQVFVPVLAFMSIALGMAFVNVKERVIETYEDKPKVDFRKSAKALLSNKYFWITNASSIFAGWTGFADGVLNYFLIYNMRLEWVSGFLSIIGVTSVVGNLLTPLLVKKFEKRTILLSLRGIWLGVTACYLLAIAANSLALLMLCIFVRSAISAACNGLNMSFNADILDYHQWKTGERADNMSTMFGWFTAPFQTVFGIVIPLLLKYVGFTSDWDVLFDSTIFTDVIRIYVFVTMGALVLATLPFFFYDLTRAKHDKCVEELRRRVYGNGAEPAMAVAGAGAGEGEAAAAEISGAEGSVEDAADETVGTSEADSAIEAEAGEEATVSEVSDDEK